MKPITQTSNTSKTINTRTLSDSVLCATFAGYMERITAYASARRKERNRTNLDTKKTPVTFEERADLNTPPAISDHVREIAPFLTNCNDITAHANEIIRDCIAFHNESEDKLPAIALKKRDPELRPLYYFMRSYTERADSNINHADKPAFREDWLYLFDSLSEDYNA